MRSRHVFLPCVLAATALLVAQDGYDRDGYAREYVQFQVLQLNQFSKEFPQQFNAALMKPPVDASKLSDTAKVSGGQVGDAIDRLAALSTAKDVMTNAEFHAQLEKALARSKELNQAMSSQRFPAPLQNEWDQMRSILNNLARTYKLEALAVLDPPGGGGRGGRGPAAAATATATAAAGPVPGGLAGYNVDAQCAKRGKGMWSNADCVARCVRDGDKIVLVSEDGNVFQISNQEKVTPETYGQVVTLLGKVDGDTITVESFKQ